jgi:hypothetical protein
MTKGYQALIGGTVSVVNHRDGGERRKRQGRIGANLKAGSGPVEHVGICAESIGSSTIE